MLGNGEKKCRNFVNSALSVGQSVSFYSPISVKIENIWTHECQNIPEMQIWW
jgi:hypothetical protein